MGEWELTQGGNFAKVTENIQAVSTKRAYLSIGLVDSPLTLKDSIEISNLIKISLSVQTVGDQFRVHLLND